MSDSAGNSAVAVASVPGLNGGRLLPGGKKGNAGGTGAAPSAIREHLRGTFKDRVPIIEAIADGKPIQRIRLRVCDLTPHVACANCGEATLQPKNEKAGWIELEVQASASPKDRIAALDLAAKYGLGQLKEISVENVRDRVANTLNVIRQHVPPEIMQEILPALRDVWA